MDQLSIRRRIIIILLGAILLIFLIPVLWRYYHTGTIIVTSDNSNNVITLTKTSEANQPPDKVKNSTGRGKLSESVASGEYTISVSGNSVATTQTITLKPRQTLRYAINPVRATGVEPVAYKNALSMAANNEQLVYLASPSNFLYEIDRKNNLTKIGGSQAFEMARWAEPSFGVGQDSEGHLYTIIDGKIKPLNLPFAYGGKPVGFDVSPDKTIYVSYGSDVYVGSQSRKFKMIYTATSPNPTLAAAPGKVAVSDTKYGKNSSDISKPLLTTIDNDGKKNKKNVEAEQLGWSPQGKYLASFNQANPTIYDAALNTIAMVPTSTAVGSVSWLNDTTLLYTVGAQLWIYDLPTKKAQLLANMPSGTSITGLYPNNDRSYVYVTTGGSSPDSNTNAIRRIGLKNQQVPEYIYNLQDILPEGAAGCLIGLVNFAPPASIFIQPYPQTSAAVCIPQAQLQLQSQGFDISQLQFQVGRPVFTD